jgi:hypothetical protein
LLFIQLTGAPQITKMEELLLGPPNMERIPRLQWFAF